MKPVTETMQDTYEWGKNRLKQAGIQEYVLDAWYLLEYVTGIDRTRYYAEPKQEIEREQKLRYACLIEKRQKRVPLQHLTGEQEFMGLKFKVNEHVLIPRQDTETLVETALEFLKKEEVPEKRGDIHLLDMCTGSGCILLSILHWAKEKSRIKGIGADISKEALAVARENAKALMLCAEFTEGNLFENIKGKFGMIVSNPPYIRTSEIGNLEPEVRNYDPIQALDGKCDGLHFYREIIRISGTYLEKRGILLLEIGCDQGAEVKAMMYKNGYSNVTVKKDLAGLDRVVWGVYDR